MIKKLLFLSGVFVFSHVSWGQIETGSWTSATLDAKINKDWKIGVEVQSRFQSLVPRLDKLFFSPHVKWDVTRHIRLATNYRFSLQANKGDYLHRFSFDVEWGKIQDLFAKKSRFDLSMRFRVLDEFGPVSRTDSYLRGLIEAAYNIKGSKVEPFLSAEVFYHFNDVLVYTTDKVIGVNQFEKYRFKAGAKRNFGASELKVFYMLNARFTGVKYQHVLGVSYTYNLDFSKK